MRTAVAIPPHIAGEAAGLAQIARIKALASLGRGDPMELANELGSTRVSKAIAAMTTGNTPDIADMRIIVSAFVQQIRNNSTFFRLLDTMVRVPFHTRVSMVATDATAWIVGEGKPIPVGTLSLDKLHLKPHIAATLLVVSEEVLRNTQSERNLSIALRRAVSAAVDAHFMALVIDGDTPTLASTGASAANAVTDVRALLDAVEPTAESSLLFAMNPEVQRAAATLTNVSGNFQFPNLTPTGGDILGVPVMPSDQLAPGSMALFDASGIAGESGTVDIDASGNATIKMLSSALEQDAVSGTGTTLVSMFQTNSIAIKALVDFDAQRIRQNAVAQLTGVNWGEGA